MHRPRLGDGSSGGRGVQHVVVYDSPATLKEKYTAALSSGLGGVAVYSADMVGYVGSAAGQADAAAMWAALDGIAAPAPAPPPAALASPTGHAVAAGGAAERPARGRRAGGRHPLGPQLGGGIPGCAHPTAPPPFSHGAQIGFGAHVHVAGMTRALGRLWHRSVARRRAAALSGCSASPRRAGTLPTAKTKAPTGGSSQGMSQEPATLSVTASASQLVSCFMRHRQSPTSHGPNCVWRQASFSGLIGQSLFRPCRGPRPARPAELCSGGSHGLLLCVTGDGHCHLAPSRPRTAGQSGTASASFCLVFPQSRTARQLHLADATTFAALTLVVLLDCRSEPGDA